MKSIALKYPSPVKTIKLKDKKTSSFVQLFNAACNLLERYEEGYLSDFAKKRTDVYFWKMMNLLNGVICEQEELERKIEKIEGKKEVQNFSQPASPDIEELRKLVEKNKKTKKKEEVFKGYKKSFLSQQFQDIKEDFLQTQTEIETLKEKLSSLNK